MGLLRQSVCMVSLLLLFAVGSAKGQTVGGYEFESGVDSTLWVDMADAQFCPELDVYGNYVRQIDIGFNFYYCGSFYRQMTVSQWGILYFNYIIQDNNSVAQSVPYMVLRYSTMPLMAPFAAMNYVDSVCWKVIGTDDNHTFVIEYNVMVGGMPRPIQVQLNEQDGSILFLYGSRGGIYLQSVFQIGFIGGDGTVVSVNQNSMILSGESTWSSGFSDWPGENRYYRFLPEVLSCCSYPKNVSLQYTTDEQVCICWHGAGDYTGYVVDYRPAFTNQNWASINTTDTCIILTDLLPSTRYEYRVRAICNDSCTSIYFGGIALVACSEQAGNAVRFADLYADNVVCRTGHYDTPSVSEWIVDYGPASIDSRHTVHTDTNERDPRTNNQLRTIPEGHCYSVRLGNWNTGREEESITYTLNVDSNLYDLLILRYAIVEVDPRHAIESQPKFLLSIQDSMGNLIDSCYYANFVAGVGDSAWHEYYDYGIVWRDWTATGIDLAPLHGRRIMVKLDNYDCQMGAHYGYAYFTMECGFKRLQSAYCGNTNTNVFYAPKGFSYRWYRADNPSVTLGRDDSLLVTGEGVYKCRASFSIGNSSCGFTLTTYAGPRFPVAAFTVVPADSCGYSFLFENHSVVARDEAHTQFTNESCEQYLWRFGDGTVSNAINPIHEFESGTYNVELVAMLANGQCSDSVSQTITINRLYDTVVDTFCMGGTYSFYGATYQTPGLHTVAFGCWQHSVQLVQQQYFYQEMEDTVCQGEVYQIGNKSFDSAGVYDVHLISVDGCDSSYHLTLAIRPLPVSDYEIARVCQESPYYYLKGKYRPADSSLAEPGSVAFVAEDGLLYRWSASSAVAPLPYLTDDGEVRVAPRQGSTYYVQYEYQNYPTCPVVDTVELSPLKEIVADLEVAPEWLGYDNMDITALDRSRHAAGRWWLVDGEEQDEEGPVLYYEASSDADSVRVAVVAYNDVCTDTAERVVPVLRHLLMFPNVFTPSLATNNRFGPIGFGITDYELWIFDRRGCLVFHSTDMAETWDGTSNGISLKQEAYAYTCHYTTPTHDRLTTTGVVTLLR